jgi:hypothetical protein
VFLLNKIRQLTFKESNWCYPYVKFCLQLTIWKKVTWQKISSVTKSRKSVENIISLHKSILSCFLHSPQWAKNIKFWTDYFLFNFFTKFGRNGLFNCELCECPRELRYLWVLVNNTEYKRLYCLKIIYWIFFNFLH